MPRTCPRIGLTCCIDQHQRPSGKKVPRLRLNLNYADSVLRAGGLPLPLVATQDQRLIDQQLDGLDGLIITGGPDVPPSQYGQRPHPKTEPLCQRRISHELALTRRADQRRIPILAICLGSQIVNVARGGTLYQHLDDLVRTPPIQHDNNEDYATHPVRIETGSLLATIIPKSIIEVNSSHHQAIDRLGTDLRPVAWAPDGTIEALEDPAMPFLLAVQWHPEALSHLPEHAALFDALVQSASRPRGPTGRPHSAAKGNQRR